MGNLLSNVRSSHQATMANGYIRGHGSGNSGPYDIYSGGDANSSPSDAEILQCLYTSRYEEHRSRVRESVEGTCSWVVEHPRYKDWLNEKALSLLWLSGDPGCGKSVTASFLVERLKSRPNSIVCYFFFKDDNNEQNNAVVALCAILHQIFMQRKHLIGFAKEGFKAKGGKLTQEVDALWNILVRAVAGGGCGDVICVLDGLDECEESTRARLIRLVAGLTRSQNSEIPLKLLVTSRPYHDIERGLCLLTPTIRLKGEEEIGAITADITRVIDDGIEELETYWGRPGGLGYLRNLLQSSADRTFLWVSLVLAELKGSEDYSSEELTRIVDTAPHELGEFYSKILNKIRSQDKARKILSIVVAAARPLTLQEMNIAFRIGQGHKSINDLEEFCPEFERTVKNLCGHFVRIIDSKIYLAHRTAKEFLLKQSSPGQGNWQHTLPSEDSNHILANACLSYLSLEEFGNESPAMFAHDGISREVVDEYLHKYPFLDYAARHWADHFRDSQDRQMEFFELTQRICKTKSERFLTWLQVYWLNAQGQYDCPTDFTHLMIALWLGQEKVVERLLEEGGEDIDARSQLYGTALNIAVARCNEGMARRLVELNVKAHICGKEYNISDVRRPLDSN